jgi:hypothetical protein
MAGSAIKAFSLRPEKLQLTHSNPTPAQFGSLNVQLRAFTPQDRTAMAVTKGSI